MESLENGHAVCCAENAGDSEIASLVYFTFFVSQDSRLCLTSLLAEKFIKALF